VLIYIKISTGLRLLQPKFTDSSTELRVSENRNFFTELWLKRKKDTAVNQELKKKIVVLCL
jgi:hypothetical protein